MILSFYSTLVYPTVFFFVLWRLLPPLTAGGHRSFNNMNNHFQSNWDEGHLDSLPFHLLLTVSPAAMKLQRDKYKNKLFFTKVGGFEFTKSCIKHSWYQIQCPLSLITPNVISWLNFPQKENPTWQKWTMFTKKKKNGRAGYTGRYDKIHQVSIKCICIELL